MNNLTSKENEDNKIQKNSSSADQTINYLINELDNNNFGKVEQVDNLRKTAQFKDLVKQNTSNSKGAKISKEFRLNYNQESVNARISFATNIVENKQLLKDLDKDNSGNYLLTQEKFIDKNNPNKIPNPNFHLLKEEF
jgi:hypothetical protein